MPVTFLDEEPVAKGRVTFLDEEPVEETPVVPINTRASDILKIENPGIDEEAYSNEVVRQMFSKSFGVNLTDAEIRGRALFDFGKDMEPTEIHAAYKELYNDSNTYDPVTTPKKTVAEQAVKRKDVTDLRSVFDVTADELIAFNKTQPPASVIAGAMPQERPSFGYAGAVAKGAQASLEGLEDVPTVIAGNVGTVVNAVGKAIGFEEMATFGDSIIGTVAKYTTDSSTAAKKATEDIFPVSERIADSIPGQVLNSLGNIWGYSKLGPLAPLAIYGSVYRSLYDRQMQEPGANPVEAHKRSALIAPSLALLEKVALEKILKLKGTPIDTSSAKARIRSTFQRFVKKSVPAAGEAATETLEGAAGEIAASDLNWNDAPMLGETFLVTMAGTYLFEGVNGFSNQKKAQRQFESQGFAPDAARKLSKSFLDPDVTQEQKDEALRGELFRPENATALDRILQNYRADLSASAQDRERDDKAELARLKEQEAALLNTPPPLPAAQPPPLPVAEGEEVPIAGETTTEPTTQEEESLSPSEQQTLDDNLAQQAVIQERLALPTKSAVEQPEVQEVVQAEEVPIKREASSPQISFSVKGVPYKASGTFLRFGKLPEGPSQNWLEGTPESPSYEKGQSVYLAYKNEKTGKYIIMPTATDETDSGESIETLDALISDEGRAIYEVSGKVLNTEGFDGEPLLEVGSSKVVREVSRKDVALLQTLNTDLTGEAMEVPASYDVEGAVKDVPDGIEMPDLELVEIEKGVWQVKNNDKGGELYGPIVGTAIKDEELERQIRDELRYRIRQKEKQDRLKQPPPLPQDEESPSLDPSAETVPALELPASQGSVTTFYDLNGQDAGIRRLVSEGWRADLIIAAAKGDAAALKALNATAPEESDDKTTVEQERAKTAKDTPPPLPFDIQGRQTPVLIQQVEGNETIYEDARESRDTHEGKKANLEYDASVGTPRLNELVQEAYAEFQQAGQNMSIRAFSILNRAAGDAGRQRRDWIRNKEGMDEREFLEGLERLSKQEDTLLEAVRPTATKAGQTLQVLSAIQQARNDFIQRYKAAHNGAEVPPEILDSFQEIADKMEDIEIRRNRIRSAEEAIRKTELNDALRDAIRNGVVDDPADAGDSEEGEVSREDLIRMIKERELQGEGWESLIDKKQSQAIRRLVKLYIKEGDVTTESTLDDVLSLLRKDIGNYTDFALFQGIEGIKGPAKEASEEKRLFQEMTKQAGLNRKIIDAYARVFDQIKNKPDPLTPEFEAELERLMIEFRTLSTSDTFNQMEPARKRAHEEQIESLLFNLNNMSRDLQYFHADPSESEQLLIDQVSDLQSAITAQDNYSKITGNLISGILTEQAKNPTKEVSNIRKRWQSALQQAQRQLQFERDKAIKAVLEGNATDEQKAFFEKEEEAKYAQALGRLQKTAQLFEHYVKPSKQKAAVLSARIQEINDQASSLKALSNQLIKNSQLAYNNRRGVVAEATPRRKVPESPELIKAKLEYAALLRDRDDLIYRTRQTGKREKLLEAVGVLRTLKFGGDLSLSMVQLAPLIWTHPKIWVGSHAEMKKLMTGADGKIDVAKLFSPDNLNLILAEIQEDPAYWLYRKAGGVLVDPASDQLQREEVAADISGDAKKEDGPVKKALQAYDKVRLAPFTRASAVGMNYARFQLFKTHMESGVFKTEAARKDLVKLIGIMTGRGSMGLDSQGDKILRSKVLNFMFSSVRLMSAAVEYSYLPLTVNDPEVRKLAWKQWGKHAVGLLGLYAMWASLFGKDSVGLDPQDSKTFMKVKIGNTWRNPLGPYGAIPKIVFRAAWYMGKNIAYQNYWTDEKPGKYTLKDDIAGFLWYRQSPGLATVLQTASQTDFLGRPYPAWKTLGAIPFTAVDEQVYDVWENSSLPPLGRIALGMGSFFGSQDYQEKREDMEGPRGLGGRIVNWLEGKLGDVRKSSSKSLLKKPVLKKPKQAKSNE